MADNYVENVEDHLSVGDEVEVKVLSIADDGKISLSIKAKDALVDHNINQITMITTTKR